MMANPGGTGKNKVILAIDDNPVNLRTLKVCLEKHFEVIPVKSGVEGLRVLKARAVDLILLDIEMPVMSGFDFLDELRIMPDKKFIPVICVTAHDATPEFISTVVHAGARDFVTKPIDSDVILGKVTKALRQPDYLL
jgi:putative two-component system response regulator